MTFLVNKHINKFKIVLLRKRDSMAEFSNKSEIPDNKKKIGTLGRWRFIKWIKKEKNHLLTKQLSFKKMEIETKQKSTQEARLRHQKPIKRWCLITKSVNKLHIQKKLMSRKKFDKDLEIKEGAKKQNKTKKFNLKSISPKFRTSASFFPILPHKANNHVIII